MAYGLAASDDDLPFQLKMWLDSVFRIARDIGTYAMSTLKAKKCELDNCLAEILNASPACEVAEKLRAKFARASPRLLTFLDFPGQSGGGDQQRLRTRPSSRCHPAKDDQRLPINVGN